MYLSVNFSIFLNSLSYLLETTKKINQQPVQKKYHNSFVNIRGEVEKMRRGDS